MAIEVTDILKGVGSAARAISDGFKKNFIHITPEDVISVLNEITIKKSQYTTESNVERLISLRLNEEIGRVHRQYSIGGYIGLKVDVDLADGKVGLEIKLAKQLNTACIERLFGQVLYYSRRTYKDNLIVVVVGQEKEYTQILREVETIIEEQGVRFHYLVVR